MVRTIKKQPIKLAFLGCGFATRLHSATLSHLKPEVHCFYASRNEGKAVGYNQKYKGRGFFGSYHAAISHPNIDVVYTRTDDTFLGLKNRTSIANKNNGQIFISIHANSSSAKSARGYEIFLLQPKSIDEAIDVAIRENASIIFEDDISAYDQNQIIADISQSTFLKESEQLAVFIQNGIKKELPKTRNRGIKQAGFHVLVGASMPNLLIETGFLTNKSEAQMLNKSTYRKKFARGIYNGIAEYIKYYNKKYIND